MLKPIYVSLSLLALTLIVLLPGPQRFEFVNFDDRRNSVGNTHIRDGLTRLLD